MSNEHVPFDEQVGLVVRAYRRRRRLSQRAFARELGMPQSTLARLERSADRSSLRTVLAVLAATDHTLGIVDADGEPVAVFDSTDLEALDRGDRRFPAHRDVVALPPGSMRPMWFMLKEYFSGGTEPGWTAEGFPVPEGTRLGRTPRPREPGEGPRFPDGLPHLPAEPKEPKEQEEPEEPPHEPPVAS